jgi:murein DD-endopeptidase MepM/ murein hydrolase activator NlpD
MRAGGLGLLLLLGGCIGPLIPPSPQGQPSQAANEEPRIDTGSEVFSAEQPVWEAQPVTANARSVSGGTYIVQPGDTLRAIGIKTGAGSETLARVNRLQPPYLLHPGDVLTVPEGRFHLVGPGETGIAISRAYGLPWRDIVVANGLEEPFTLRIGQRLQIPGTGTATPPTTVPASSDGTLEARAAAFKLNIEDIVSGGEPAVAADAPLAIPLPPARLSSGFAWPADGRIASGFGPKGEGQYNQGIEIAVVPAAPIVASADGVVAFVGKDVAPVGGLILVRHGDGWISAYGHAAAASVTRGQKLVRGQVIGKAGNGTTPLVFFQLRRNGTPVDPVKHLPLR